MTSDPHHVQALTPDQVWTQLVEIERQLSELPQEAYDQRVSLRERRGALRARANELSRGRRDPDQLREELERLRGLLRDIFGHHVSVGHMGGAGGRGGGGIEPRYAFQLNRAIDQGWDRAGIEARIKEIEVELERLQE